MHPSWKPLFDQYDIDLEALYSTEVYPSREQVFRVFEMDVRTIRIVILGQDPYHGPGQAHGLCFSVPHGVAIPPSLQNIFKELKRGFPERNYSFSHGSLEAWVSREQICLLNASLTVLPGQPGSHMKVWEEFTDDCIRFISRENPRCVFVLLGNFAKAKQKLIEHPGSRIVSEVHPSPLARGFVGSGVFLRVEKALGEAVNWSNETL